MMFGEKKDTYVFLKGYYENRGEKSSSLKVRA